MKNQNPMEGYSIPPLLLSILAGILIGTSYIPFPPWAIFFCFVPLWCAWLRARSFKQIIWWSWIAQFVLTLIGFNWVAYTVHEFGQLPWIVAVITLFLFCGFANLQLVLAGIVWYWLFRNESSMKKRILAMVVLLAIAERIYPMIFDWHFGFTWLWAGFPAYQLADIWGFFGLSTIGIFFNGLVMWAFQKKAGKTDARRVDWKPIGLVAVLFILMNIAGYWKVQHLPKPDRVLRPLIVQANIGDQEKIMAERGAFYKSAILDKFFNLTAQGLKNAKEKPSFAVWPETAYPDVLIRPNMDYGYAGELREFLAKNQLPLVTGAYSFLPASRQVTNSMFVLDQNGMWASAPYHKTMLLAFGEYMPGGDWFPFLYKWLPQVSHFGRGSGPTLLHLGDVRIGAEICYEGLYDWFARRLANLGSQVIVNITNDSWFGTWEEPYQHMFMTLSHAVELRRPLIRSTNTGISSVILADGRILQPSPLHTEWEHLYEVPYLENPPPTIFMSWGYWIFPGLLGILLIGLLVTKESFWS